jgi:SAM-dependent methyltransferase
VTGSSAPAPTPAINREKAGAFVERLKGTYQSTMLTMMIDLGHRSGVLAALRGAGPITTEVLAARTDQSIRHLQEWLSAMAVAGVLDFDPDADTFSFPEEHAMWLTGAVATNLAPMAGMLIGLAQRSDDVLAAFDHGQGVPYENYRPHFTHAMDELGRAKYDEMLLSAYLPKAPGLPERLHAGADVADFGCGTGHCLNLMAAAHPESRFTGFDISTEALALAESEATNMGLTNVRFIAADVAKLDAAPRFDVAFAFDSIHDQADPAGVLGIIRSSLRAGGELFMVDIKASSYLVENLADPMNLMLYGISVMHCMEVSLAVGGAGLGTAWGTQLATSMLHDAGFAEVTVHDIERDPSNCIYVCR